MPLGGLVSSASGFFDCAVPSVLVKRFLSLTAADDRPSCSIVVVA